MEKTDRLCSSRVMFFSGPEEPHSENGERFTTTARAKTKVSLAPPIRDLERLFIDIRSKRTYISAIRLGAWEVTLWTSRKSSKRASNQSMKQP